MPKPPILKPREVIRLLERHGFVEVRQTGRTSSFAIPTDERRHCQTTAVEMCRLFCSGRSQKTLA